MVSVIVVLVLIEVAIIEAFHGFVHQNDIRSLVSRKIQLSPSPLNPSSRFRLDRHEKTRVFATTTETTNDKVIVADVTPIAPVESTNWLEPVPYSQLLIGVPRETLEGQI